MNLGDRWFESPPSRAHDCHGPGQSSFAEISRNVPYKKLGPPPLMRRNLKGCVTLKFGLLFRLISSPWLELAAHMSEMTQYTYANAALTVAWREMSFDLFVTRPVSPGDRPTLRSPKGALSSGGGGGRTTSSFVRPMMTAPPPPPPPPPLWLSGPLARSRIHATAAAKSSRSSACSAGLFKKPCRWLRDILDLVHIPQFILVQRHPHQTCTSLN